MIILSLTFTYLQITVIYLIILSLTFTYLQVIHLSYNVVFSLYISSFNHEDMMIKTV